MEKLQFKGTKGKWHPNVISTITIGVHAEIEKTSIGIYSQNVCEFQLPNTDEEYDNDREEREANAKLIAASPELLENLIRLVDRIEENKFQDSMPSAYLRAKKAIEKALK